MTTIATPTGEDGTLHIKQDATLHQLILEPGTELEMAIEAGRNVYVHHVEGTLKTDDVQLESGDGAKIEDQTSVRFANQGESRATALIFDLP